MPDTILTTDQPTERNFIVQGPRQRSAQWGDLMIALAKAQGEIEGAKKDSENPHFKSSYADLASVWTAIREPLSKNGLAIMQWPRVTENAVEIETIVAHGEQFISDVLWMPCSKMDAHGIGSAITYGRRYALMAVAGVAPEDDDGNGAIAGAAGSAAGGKDFRPPGPRRFQSNGGGGNTWVKEALNDGLIPNGDTRSRYQQGRDAKAAPKPASDALGYMDFITKSRDTVKNATDKTRLGQWWRDTKDERDAAESALPAEFDKLMTDFDAKMESLP